MPILTPNFLQDKAEVFYFPVCPPPTPEFSASPSKTPHSRFDQSCLSPGATIDPSEKSKCNGEEKEPAKEGRFN